MKNRWETTRIHTHVLTIYVYGRGIFWVAIGNFQQTNAGVAADLDVHWLYLYCTYPKTRHLRYLCIWLVMRRPWNRSLTVALTILDRSMDSDFFMGRWASTIEEMLPSPLLDFDEMNALLSPYPYSFRHGTTRHLGENHHQIESIQISKVTPTTVV